MEHTSLGWTLELRDRCSSPDFQSYRFSSLEVELSELEGLKSASNYGFEIQMRMRCEMFWATCRLLAGCFLVIRGSPVLENQHWQRLLARSSALVKSSHKLSRMSQRQIWRILPRIAVRQCQQSCIHFGPSTVSSKQRVTRWNRTFMSGQGSGFPAASSTNGKVWCGGGVGGRWSCSWGNG